MAIAALGHAQHLICDVKRDIRQWYQTKPRIETALINKYLNRIISVSGEVLGALLGTLIACVGVRFAAGLWGFLEGDTASKTLQLIYNIFSCCLHLGDTLKSASHDLSCYLGVHETEYGALGGIGPFVLSAFQFVATLTIVYGAVIFGVNILSATLARFNSLMLYWCGGSIIAQPLLLVSLQMEIALSILRTKLRVYLGVCVIVLVFVKSYLGYNYLSMSAFLSISHYFSETLGEIVKSLSHLVNDLGENYWAESEHFSSLFLRLAFRSLGTAITVYPAVVFAMHIASTIVVRITGVILRYFFRNSDVVYLVGFIMAEALADIRANLKVYLRVYVALLVLLGNLLGQDHVSTLLLLSSPAGAVLGAYVGTKVGRLTLSSYRFIKVELLRNALIYVSRSPSFFISNQEAENVAMILHAKLQTCKHLSSVICDQELLKVCLPIYQRASRQS